MKRGQSFAVGDTIGKLTLIGLADASGCGVKRWLCRCECGAVVVKNTANARRAKANGCPECSEAARVEKRKTHGEYGSALYRSWRNMKQRCNNPRATNYQWYGGKGIKVCEQWQKFEAFRDWANDNGFADGLVIDRINPAGNYEPSNCRWLTASENCRLARVNH